MNDVSTLSLSRASSAPPPTETASLPGRRPLLPAPAGNTLIRGDLVTYERDTRYPAAWTLYVVLDAPKRDSKNRLRVRIQAIHRATIFAPGVTTFHPMDVLVDEVVPLAAYGMRISRIVRRFGHAVNFLFLERDRSIEATAPRRFGRPLADQWDWCGIGSICSDELAGLIRDPDLLLAADDCAAGIDADPIDDEPDTSGQEDF